MKLQVIASETDKSAFIQRLSGERAAQHYAAIVESSTDAILSKDLNGSSRAGTAVPNFSLATRRRKRWGSRSPF
jgi:hypothetical protein